MGNLADPAGFEYRGAPGDPHVASVWVGYGHLTKKPGPQDIADSKGNKHKNRDRIVGLCHLVDLRDNRESSLGYCLNQYR